jgi:hypothetical protein
MMPQPELLNAHHSLARARCASRMHVILPSKKKNRKASNERQPALGLWMDPMRLPTRLAEKGSHRENTWAERLSGASHDKYLDLADLSLKHAVLVKLNDHDRQE